MKVHIGSRLLLFLLAAFCLLFKSQHAASVERCLNIEKIQKAIEEEGAKWTAGHTSMSCRADVHIKPLSLLRSIINTHTAEHRPGAFNPAADIPGNLLPDISPDEIRFSWHDYEGQDWMSPVRNQGGCNSCYAFAAVGAIEGAFNIELEDPDLDLDLSEQSIVCALGCDGSGAQDALGLIEAEGVPDEECYRYLGVDGNCEDKCSDWRARVVRLHAWALVEPSFDPIRTMKELIIRSPVVRSITIRTDFYTYTEGVYQPVSGDWLGGHDVDVVGWDDSHNSWICKNSWGTDWGMDGYFEIDRDEYSRGDWWIDVDETSIEVPPRADFTADPLEGFAPLSVQFTSLSYGTIDSHEWDFGDGSGNASGNPLHFYENPGTYSVSLTVSGGLESDTKTKADYILVTQASEEEIEEGEPLEEDIDNEFEPEHPVEEMPEARDGAVSDSTGEGGEEDGYSENGCGCGIII